MTAATEVDRAVLKSLFDRKRRTQQQIAHDTGYKLPLIVRSLTRLSREGIVCLERRGQQVIPELRIERAMQSLEAAVFSALRRVAA